MSKFNISSVFKTVTKNIKYRQKKKILQYTKQKKIKQKQFRENKVKNIQYKRKILFNFKLNKIFSVLMLLRRFLKFYKFLKSITKYFILQLVQAKISVSKSFNTLLKYSVNKKSLLQGLINFCIFVLQVPFVRTNTIPSFSKKTLNFFAKHKHYINFRLKNKKSAAVVLQTPQQLRRKPLRTFEMLTFQKYKLLYLFLLIV